MMLVLGSGIGLAIVVAHKLWRDEAQAINEMAESIWSEWRVRGV